MCNKCYLISGRGDGKGTYCKSKMDANMVKKKLGEGLVVSGSLLAVYIFFLAPVLMVGLVFITALLWTIGRGIIYLLGLGFRRER